MKLSEILNEENILLDVDAENKAEVINKLLKTIFWGGNKDELLRKILAREELGSSGIGEGVAVPHIKIEYIEQPIVVFGRTRKAIDFCSLDNIPCQLFFLVIGSSRQEYQELYLDVMARISRLMRYDNIREEFLKAKTPKEILEIIKHAEKENNLSYLKHTFPTDKNG